MLPDSDRTWSQAATHCVWCGNRTAVEADYRRHDDEDDERDSECDSGSCWCIGVCWENCDERYSDPEALLSGLRAELERTEGRAGDALLDVEGLRRYPCPHIHTSGGGTNFCDLAQRDGELVAKARPLVAQLRAEIDRCGENWEWEAVPAPIEEIVARLEKLFEEENEDGYDSALDP